MESYDVVGPGAGSQSHTVEGHVRVGIVEPRPLDTVRVLVRQVRHVLLERREWCSFVFSASTDTVLKRIQSLVQNHMRHVRGEFCSRAENSAI